MVFRLKDGVTSASNISKEIEKTSLFTTPLMFDVSRMWFDAGGYQASTQRVNLGNLSRLN